MRIVHLEPGPIGEAVASLLRCAPVYVSDPWPVAFEALKRAGLNPIVAGDEIPDDSILVIPVGPLEALVQVADRLLGPGGCPWDQAQTHESLKKYLLEESYELIDAIDSGSHSKMLEELGDVLLQPIMHAQMSRLRGGFDTHDVAQGITDKLIRRHPHVFGSATADTPEEVLRNWDQIKRAEGGEELRSVLEGVPRSMAALLRAHEVSKRAARAGFEWPDLASVFDKLAEEEKELHEAIQAGDQAQIESEIGDLLFTAVNIARWLQVEPEDALRKMLDRFTTRFKSMEESAGRELADLTFEEWDELWNRAKASCDK